MYSTDLTKISLKEFKEILKNSNLLPSQKVILENIDENFKKIEKSGINNLDELQKLLKNKNRFEIISSKLIVDSEYLTILNRMVNSYEVKSITLEKSELFLPPELDILLELGIKNSKDFYEYFLKNKHTKIKISNEKIEYALYIIDLLRINGVGLEYAKMLYEIGIKCVSDYLNTNSESICEKINNYIEIHKNLKSKIRIEDVEYCRRFCEKLDCEIK